MNRPRATLVVGILLLTAITSLPVAQSTSHVSIRAFTSSPTSSTCLPSTITQPFNVNNTQCAVTTEVIVAKGASLTLLNSNIAGSGLNIQILLAGSANLTLVRSSLSNIAIVMTGRNNSLSANDGSSLSLTSFQDPKGATILLNSTVIHDAGPMNVSGADSIGISDSIISASVSVLSLDASTVTISDSNLSNIDNIGTIDSSLIVTGQNVSILSSSLVSSANTNYAFASSGRSTLIVNGTSGANILSSLLVAGMAASSSENYKSSDLMISGGSGNLSISNSRLESLSTSPVVSLVADSSPESSLNLSNSFVSTQNFEGNLRLLSSRSILLNSTNVDCSYDALKVISGTLDAYNSEITVANVSRDLTFGGSLESGLFYNTTLSHCPVQSSTCLAVSAPGGSYSIWNPLLIHVSFANTSQPASGVTVFAMQDSGITAYNATTNASGWAVIRALYAHANDYTLVKNPYYILEACSGGMSSLQTITNPSNSSVANLVVVDPTLADTNVSQLSQNNISAALDLRSYSYEIAPHSAYQIGPYISSEDVANIVIMSNAVPLNFRNNGTAEELDFNTIGPNGSNSGSFNFVLIYPKNSSTTPMKISVDGSTDSSVSLATNSTDYFSSFSIPSGSHLITLFYTRPSGYYSAVTPGYPQIYPATTTIIAIVVISAVGIAFVVAYVRRHDEQQR